MDSFAQGLVGVVLDDRYRLDALLGEGGMGAVFRAHHLAMDRKVAVKLLKPHLASDEAALRRFAREARSTLKVDSPHAVKVLDFGVTPLRDYYMVLEYLDGRSVQRELEIDGAFTPERVLHIARQSLHALAASHRSGLVHRDIKPDNIFLMRVEADPDYTKLLDFGVAKLMEGAATSSRSQLALTAAGMVFGTPEFMSPEQACGHALDGRSDLYSLAATMWTMLTGTALFEGKTPIEWLTHHARTPPPRLESVRPELAAYPALDDLLQTCLAKQRERRPSTADEMARMLVAVGPSVSGAPAAHATRAAKATMFSASSYFQVLPSEGAETVSARPPRPLISPLSSQSALPQQRGRGYLVVIALGVLAMVGVAIGVAVHKRASPAVAAARDAGRTPDSAIDAPPADAPRDAPADAPPDAQIAHVIRTPPRSAAVDGLLRNAEESLRADNRLKQLYWANEVLAIDPHNARAHYLAGDAQIKDGDLPGGCAHLHALGKNPMAQARAHAAGCPD